MSQNKALDVKILLYASKHKGDQRDLSKLSKQLKIRSSEGFIYTLKQLEEENFLVSDPRIWRLTAKGETKATVMETSQKNHLHLILICVVLCVALFLTIVAKNLL
jgi:hypothetical protein